MKIPMLSLFASELQGAETRLPRGDGFAALLSAEGLLTVRDPGEGAEQTPPPEANEDLAALLTDLHAAMTEDLRTLPQLSPAGLERVEQAMAGTIVERLETFDAEHGTEIMGLLGGGAPGDPAARLFQAMASEAVAPRTPEGSLDAAFEEVAAALGLDTMTTAAPAVAAAIVPRAAPEPVSPAPAPSQRARNHNDVPQFATVATGTVVLASRQGAEPLAASAAPQPDGTAVSEGAPRSTEAEGRERRLMSESAGAAPSGPDRPRSAPVPAAPQVPPIPAAPARPGEPQIPLAPLAPPTPSAPAAATTVAPPPAPPAPPAPPEPPVLDQIRRIGITTGRTRIELSPEGLGALEIDLSADEAGQLRVVVRAENAAVLSMLRGDRAGLLNALDDGGVALGDAGLDFESFTGDRRDRDERSAPALPGAHPSDAPVEPRAADPAIYRPRPVDGRLDILT